MTSPLTKHPELSSELPLVTFQDEDIFDCFEKDSELKLVITNFLQIVNKDLLLLLKEKKISEIHILQTHFKCCVLLLIKRTVSHTEFSCDFQKLETAYLSLVRQQKEPEKIIEKFIIDHEEA